MDTSEFKEVFAAEARDYLQSLNNDLLLLENDPTNSDILDDMFRAAHSLKGMAGTMGLKNWLILPMKWRVFSICSELGNLQPVIGLLMSFLAP